MPEALSVRIRDLTDKAVDALERGLSSDDERIRLESARTLLDRAYGKAITPNDIKVESADLNGEHLRALQERMARRPDTGDAA